MTRDEPPPRQNDLFLQRRGDHTGAEVLAKHNAGVDLDPDLDELVDKLIEAPEFAEARQIAEALGINPDAESGSDRAGARRDPKHEVRDVDGTVNEIDFDLADLLARASDELEARQARTGDHGAKAAPATHTTRDAGMPDGFSAGRFEPDPVQLESFPAPSRLKVGERPRLAIVGGHRAEGKAVTDSEKAKPVDHTAAAAPAAPSMLREAPRAAKAETGMSDDAGAARLERVPAAKPSRQDIEDLWQQTSRLERRLAAAQDLRDSRGRGVASASSSSTLSMPPSRHPRFPLMDGTPEPGRWRRRLLSWLAAALVAAAIIAAGHLGVMDPARAWLHQQLGWSPAGAAPESN